MNPADETSLNLDPFRPTTQSFQGFIFIAQWHIIYRLFYLVIDLFPGLTALDALRQGLHAWVNISIKDTVQVDLFAASSDQLIAQL